MAHNLDVTTTNREVFKAEESSRMAQLVFKRFGRDLEAATRAWNRMMQTNIEPRTFKGLVELELKQEIARINATPIGTIEPGPDGRNRYVPAKDLCEFCGVEKAEIQHKELMICHRCASEV